jgi:hypothetical protein
MAVYVGMQIIGADSFFGKADIDAYLSLDI